MVEPGSGGSERLLTLCLNTTKGPVTLISMYAPYCPPLQMPRMNSMRTLHPPSGTSPVLSNLFSCTTSMPKWVQAMTHGPLALVLLEWGKWMRMDSNCSNSVSFTTCALPTSSSRPSLNTRSPGDTRPQSIGTNWIWSWSGMQPSRMFFTHALTTVQTVTWTTPWYAVRSGCNQKSSIVQKNREPTYWHQQDDSARSYGTVCRGLWGGIWCITVWRYCHREVGNSARHHLPHCPGYLWEENLKVAWLVWGQVIWDDPHYWGKACHTHWVQAVTHQAEPTLSGLPGARSNALPGAAPMSTGQSTGRLSRWLLQWATSEGCMMTSRRHWDQYRAKQPPSNLPLGKSSQTKAGRWRDGWNTILTSYSRENTVTPQSWVQSSACQSWKGSMWSQPWMNSARSLTVWLQARHQAATVFLQTSSSTARPPYCTPCMKSSASAGERELCHKTWEMPRSLPCTRTRVREVTATAIEASLFSALLAKSMLGSSRSACRSWLSMSTQNHSVASDMVFSLHQLQEKCREQWMPLYIAFIDITKAFDLVSRDGLFKALCKISCPPRLHSLIESFHSNMKGTVQFNGNLSEPFNMCSRVKQGCVLTPTLFGIFFTLLLGHAFGTAQEGIYLQTRSDGSLFNLAHLKARTKVHEVLIRDMLFADDVTVMTYTQRELQLLMDHFSQACKDFRLIISLKKTNVLGQDILAPPVITINDYELKVLHQFTYFGSTITDNLSLDPEINKRDWEGSHNTRSPDIKSVDKPQVDNEDKDGCVQCLHPQHPALWQQDMDHICPSREKAQHFPP